LFLHSGKGLAAVALAGLPLGLSVIQSPAVGQSSANTTALTLLLKLALLEQAFYTQATQSGTLAALDFTSDELAAVNTILAHETAHVTLLSTLTQATAPAGGYDFTAGSGTQTGPYSPFTNKADFFALAVYLEDLGVRAYLGALGNLVGDPQLTTVSQLHSTEARHAAQIRRLRDGVGTEPYMPTGWDTTPGTLDNAVYGPGTTTYDAKGIALPSTGEDNRIQVTSYTPQGFDTFLDNGASFDEPLSAANVLVAATFFGVS